VLRCVFKRGIDGGARGKAGKSAGDGAVDPSGEELEVGGDTDWWGRPGSECEREGGGSWAALASWAGRGSGPAGKGEKEREESCWAGPRGEGERV
jgi:hypothetical protein